jgi:hypothetical protein
MRLSLRVGLTIALGVALSSGTVAYAQRPARPALHPPAHCPERRSLGFCPYDSGWRPVRDNPLFSPLLPGDPQGDSGPLCAISDSHGRTLLSYETEAPAPAMRIGGSLVRFHQAAEGVTNIFFSPTGRLRIVEGETVARDRESDGHRATLTFIDRSGDAHNASVRIDCGL